MAGIKYIHAYLLADLMLVTTIFGWAQEPSTPAVDAMFGDLTKPGSPGCAVGIYRNGKIIFGKGYGYANLEENVPITPQTVFDVGSVAKQFTAACILLLKKQGKLKLDDDVRKYVPELPDYSAQTGHKITILHLLHQEEEGLPVASSLQQDTRLQARRSFGSGNLHVRDRSGSG